MYDLRYDLRCWKNIIRSDRISLVIRYGLLLRIARIYRSEKAEHVKMQHRPQGQRLAFHHPVVIFSKEFPVCFNILKKHVAVQDQGICLVPCLVHPCSPILGTVPIF